MSAAPIRSDDPNAIAQLEEKIAGATKRQDFMRAVNRIVRAAGRTDEEKILHLQSELNIEPVTGRNLVHTKDYRGRPGYMPYELTNNSANLRRMEERLRVLRSEATRVTAEAPFPGGRIVDAVSASRVRIYHDEKPPKETIAALKANGFHWTPSEKCWQRLSGGNARAAAERVTGAKFPQAEPVAASPAVGQRPEAPRMGMSP